MLRFVYKIRCNLAISTICSLFIRYRVVRNYYGRSFENSRLYISWPSRYLSLLDCNYNFGIISTKGSRLSDNYWLNVWCKSCHIILYYFLPHFICLLIALCSILLLLVAGSCTRTAAPDALAAASAVVRRARASLFILARNYRTDFTFEFSTSTFTPPPQSSAHLVTQWELRPVGP